VLKFGQMPTDSILSLLISERDKLNRAIAALQGTPGRGRPPKGETIPANGYSLALAAELKPKRHVSAASRRKMALAQKRRWAAFRAAK
jgi:hypothetical protein